jgi:hypothetical protein
MKNKRLDESELVRELFRALDARYQTLLKQLDRACEEDLPFEYTDLAVQDLRAATEVMQRALIRMMA